jgi:hypothetical protein
MMRFALVVVLIAAVEASTILPLDCPPGSGMNNPTSYYGLSSTYYSVQGLSATYYNAQPTGTAEVGGATSPFKAQLDAGVDYLNYLNVVQSLTSRGDFSVRWTGFVKYYFGSTVPAGYIHTFHTPTYANWMSGTWTDERVRLWIDNSLVIDQWTSLSTAQPSGTVSLPVIGAYYSLIMDYKVGTTSPRIQLKWTNGGGSGANAGYTVT